MKQLPIGSADFKSIRETNDVYADKTALIYELVKTRSQYFLSRPRRFGKSMLVSTIKAVFEGRRDLFKGLAIDDRDYDWKPHPVIHLSLNGVDSENVDVLRRSLNRDLKSVANRNGLEIGDDRPVDLMKSLIEGLSYRHKERTGENSDKSVVVLIDEYDAPILDHVTDEDMARAIRLALKSFYGVLKGCEDYLRFVFITGVTKFTKTSLFSELNNLVDLTLDRNFAGICGFTTEEFDSLFAEHLEAALASLKTEGSLSGDATADDLRQEILDWYDGYSWDGQTRVLNPWSVLNCLRYASLENFWFESGNPSFLLDVLKKSRGSFVFLEAPPTITNALNAVDVGSFKPVPLMFQAGYLTVDGVDSQLRGTSSRLRKKSYRLRYPNLEVMDSLVPLLLTIDSPLGGDPQAMRLARAMADSLAAKDASGLEAAFSGLLNMVPYYLHHPLEKYYHSLFLFALKMAGREIQSETAKGGGRLDASLKTVDGEELVIEFKHHHEPPQPSGKPKPSKKRAPRKELSKELKRAEMEKTALEALNQIEVNGYALELKASGTPYCKIAIVIRERIMVLAKFEKG